MGEIEYAISMRYDLCRRKIDLYLKQIASLFKDTLKFC